LPEIQALQAVWEAEFIYEPGKVTWKTELLPTGAVFSNDSESPSGLTIPKEGECRKENSGVQKHTNRVDVSGPQRNEKHI
jgi:hypothetical protein